MKKFIAPKFEDYASADDVEWRNQIKQASAEANERHRQLINNCKAQDFADDR